jgi:hypothetical protein
MTTYIEYAKFFNLRGPPPQPEPLKSELSTQIEAAGQADKDFRYLFGSSSEKDFRLETPLIFDIETLPNDARHFLIKYLTDKFQDEIHA